MEPMVSVYCPAYNHEKYIRSALEGFVSQKTDFAYEVFVHDDASTDNTAAIIREYAERYPDIIKPIFQTENQFSKGIRISETFIFPLMKGKYVAACEGDDYWCDENKLQRQVDWLESHPDYSLCVHNTMMLDAATGEESLMYSGEQDRDIPLTDILVGGGAQFQTSSIMFRSEFTIIPEALKRKKVGDYPRAIYLGTCGKVRFLRQVMSVYRTNVPNSASALMRAETISMRDERLNETIRMLRAADQYTNGLYSDYIEDIIRKKKFNYLVRDGDYETIKKEYMDLYGAMDRSARIKLQIKYRFPGLTKTYKSFKKR